MPITVFNVQCSPTYIITPSNVTSLSCNASDNILAFIYIVCWTPSNIWANTAAATFRVNVMDGI